MVLIKSHVAPDRSQRNSHLETDSGSIGGSGRKLEVDKLETIEEGENNRIYGSDG